jgi:hypothetical protein
MPKCGVSLASFCYLTGSKVVYHLVVMLCNESGLETEKAMRMTCAWLYASGRRRS